MVVVKSKLALQLFIKEVLSKGIKDWGSGYPIEDPKEESEEAYTNMNPVGGKFFITNPDKPLLSSIEEVVREGMDPDQFEELVPPTLMISGNPSIVDVDTSTYEGYLTYDNVLVISSRTEIVKLVNSESSRKLITEYAYERGFLVDFGRLTAQKS